MDQKEIKRFIFNLIIENETLENLDDAMLALFGLCTNQTEFEVVKHSLEKLVILSPRSLSRLISKFSQDIIEISKNCDKVAVVASAFDANPDGSQLLIQLLKSISLLSK